MIWNNTKEKTLHTKISFSLIRSGGPVSDEDRIRGADVHVTVVVAHDVNLVKAKGDPESLVAWAQEAEGVHGELELGADAHKDAALRFHAALPAELQWQHVFILVRLDEEEEMKTVFQNEQPCIKDSQQQSPSWTAMPLYRYTLLHWYLLTFTTRCYKLQSAHMYHDQSPVLTA